MRILTGTLLVLLVAVSAHAALVLDQQQTSINLGTAGEGFLVGGIQHYMLAQTVTAGLSGRLARVEFPVVCESGRLDLEIRNLVPGEVDGTMVPGGMVLGRASADASAFPSSGGFIFRAIDLPHPVSMAAGDQYAIVLNNDSGRCGVGMGLDTDLYPRGASYWRYDGTPAGTWLSTGGFADPIDTAFRTWVETGPPHVAGFAPCAVSGFGSIPIPSFVPLCRCLQDPGLRESRCGFFHPSMFLVRSIPSPLPPGQPFAVKWTLFALRPLDGTVEVDDLLPRGFQGPKQPLLFFGSQIPAGSALTLSYQAVASSKSGTSRLQTHVSIAPEAGPAEQGTLRTTIEVTPP